MSSFQNGFLSKFLAFIIFSESVMSIYILTSQSLGLIKLFYFANSLSLKVQRFYLYNKTGLVKVSHISNFLGSEDHGAVCV